MTQEAKPTALITYTPERQMAVDFAKSGYFQDAHDVSQAVVKIAAGRELGVGPVTAMTKIYIVKGKVMVSAELLGAVIKRSNRYDYRVTEYTDQAVTIVFTDNGKDVFTSRFTIEEAKRADLVKPDSGWSKWPRAMLTSKALSQGARIVAPHLIAGAYTPEDFGGTVNPDTGEITGIVVTDITEEAGKDETPKEHWCTEHKTAYFKKGQMKAFGHPIEGDANGKWCHEHKADDTGYLPNSPAASPAARTAPPAPDKPLTAKRDPATIKSIAELCKALSDDFHMDNKAAWAELNIKSWPELTLLPSEAYILIRQVKAGPPA